MDIAADRNFHEGGAKADTEQRRKDVFRAASTTLDDKAGRQDHAEKAEAGALQAKHAGTDRADPFGLDERPDAGNEQRHAHQIGHVIAQTKHAADDQGGGDDANETGQHMLNCSKGCREWTRTIFELIDQVLIGSVTAPGFGCGHGQACH